MAKSEITVVGAKSGPRPIVGADRSGLPTGKEGLGDAELVWGCKKLGKLLGY